ncbi:MAG: ATP-binding protein [Gemmatimonas sp.]
MRHTPAFPQVAIQEMLDPGRIMRWVWLGRVMLACAILLAAVFVWNRAEPNDTLIATLAFAVATLATVGSVMWSELQQRPRGNAFYGVQCAIDLALVTAIVHITGGWSSQFAALYIPVIASAALLLPFRGGLAVAAAACVLNVTDVVWLRAGEPQFGMVVQLVVFVVVALGSGFVASRLRQAGMGRDALAAQLVKVQLEAADILRTIRSGILTIESSGHLLYANPAANDLLGINLRSFVGRPVLPTLRAISPRLVTLLEQSSRDGVRTTRAEGLIHRNGEAVEIGVTTTTGDRSQSVGGNTATAIFQDISDSKRLQALHIRAERLQAVAELSASLAHEIRNPLASIRSATEQLARRRAAATYGTEDEDERVLHGLVVREADRLSRLLGDFLDFARARVTRIAAVDVGAVATAAALLASAHPDRGDDVVVDTMVEADLPMLHGDEDLLHRAVFNLVLNAVQAVGPSGHVQVDVRRHDVNSARSALSIPGDVIAISVTDDGPGVHPDVREHLFEPFVTAKPGGTGLGLPVVHRAVEAHRGIVLVDSLPQGTRFTAMLPLTSAVVDYDMPHNDTMPGEDASATTRLTGAAT